MNKKRVKKFVKVGGILLLVYVGAMLFMAAMAKPTKSSGIEEPEWFSDKCEDEEFYNLTHNADETLNDYGKSLI
jgi:hypothetical protein